MKTISKTMIWIKKMKNMTDVFKKYEINETKNGFGSEE